MYKSLQLHSAAVSVLVLTTVFMISTAVRAQTAASSSASAAPAAASKPDDIKVSFDEKDPTIMYVESKGERVRVNTVTKVIERITPEGEPAGQAQSPTAAATTPVQTEEKEDFYAYESGDEPFDYRLINVPTPKKVPKGTWNMWFSHRFSQPIHPISESGRSLLGFDSMSLSSFGVMYGITDKLYVSAYRSPLCQTGLCRTIEVGLGYHVTDQTKRSPVALNFFASAEGNENFTQEFTYNLQAMISRHFGKRVYVYFSPAIHLNSNGQRRFDPRPEDYFPPATVANTFRLPTHGASFGMGASVRITPSIMAMFEFTPRTGFKLGRTEPIFDPNFDIVGFNNISHPEMGIGLQYNVGKHSFTLTLSNTQTTTTSRYNSSNLVLSPKNLVIGFNLFRRW